MNLLYTEEIRASVVSRALSTSITATSISSCIPYATIWSWIDRWKRDKMPTIDVTQHKKHQHTSSKCRIVSRPIIPDSGISTMLPDDNSIKSIISRIEALENKLNRLLGT